MRHRYHEPNPLAEFITRLASLTLAVCLVLVAVFCVGLMTLGVWDCLHTIARGIK